MATTPVHAANNDAAFTVQGVKVDVTAENASAARDQAFAQAQTAAFKQLAERLLSDNELETFQPPEPDVISTMVTDFEITDEQLSNVRYVGTYTFRFKHDAVRAYMGGKNLAYTDVTSKPVLILPYYQQGAQTLLWGNGNPWLTAWNTSKAARGLVPVLVPIGDLQDVSEMTDNEALTYAPDKLQDMTKRYEAGEAIILLASPEWSSNAKAAANQPPDKLIVMIYRTDRGQPEYANKLTVTEADAAGEESIFAAGVKICRQTLQKAWKNQTVVKAEEKSTIKARVSFNTMQEWIETQQKLRAIRGINDMKILSLSQGEANLELNFQGTEDRLRLALAQADMSLSAPQAYVNAAAPQQPYNYTYDYNGDNNYNNGSAPQPRQAPQVYDLYLNKYKHY